MKVIQVRNVHDALPYALRELALEGIDRDSRNGAVRKFEEPVTTVYARPTERVLFWPKRDANPFFHFMESLWMLAGRNDVEFVARYNAQMRAYSDDGATFHGAYGYRWVNHFGYNQLLQVILSLAKNPDDRRVVLSMWDARVDLGKDGKDFPCNLQALFSVNELGQLDMTVTNRSNDLIWGAYGANAVHFSMLQEFVARALGRPVGRYWQVSNNLHAYKEKMGIVEGIAEASYYNPYGNEEVEPYTLMATPWNEWVEDLKIFLTAPEAIGYRDPFFRRVAVPLHLAWAEYKRLDRDKAESIKAAAHALDQCRATDWKRACLEWLDRRLQTYNRVKDDGAQHEQH